MEYNKPKHNPYKIVKMFEEEMAHYRAPFLEPGEDRRPTLTWPRQVPIDGEPQLGIEGYQLRILGEQCPPQIRALREGEGG